MDGKGVTMFKLDKNIRKRLLSYIIANMLLLLVVFGALMAGFVVFAARADVKAVENGASAYAAQLKACTLEELMDLCQGSISRADLENPAYSFGIYTVRGDNSYGFYCKDAFLVQNNPSIGGRSDTFEDERIGGRDFVTYTTSVKDNAGAYIKVFAPVDFRAEAVHTVKVYSVPFSIAFVVLCVVISLMLGYIEIRPITENYYKQKNFINDMSHEIRTPLAIIRGNLENVLAAPDATVAQVSEGIAECLDEVDYMNNMSSGLLSIVKGGSKSLKREAYLSDTVSESVESVAELASMSNKSLIACVDNCDMSVDKEKIKQLMSVLLENALKYTDEGDMIKVRLKNVKEGCVLVVSDTGIGVGKNELESIFDRFYRAENVGDRQGTGLGLSIAKSIAESMNGTIKANHNVPKGLEIMVTLKRG